jgi:hypothetical protein
MFLATAQQTGIGVYLIVASWEKQELNLCVREQVGQSTTSWMAE